MSEEKRKNAKSPEKSDGGAIVQQSLAQSVEIPADYAKLLKDLKSRIRTACVKANLSVNMELVLLYWEIGKAILQRQLQEGWGTKIIERLSQDLRQEFPDMKGFSRANLFYMRAFAAAYPNQTIVQQVVGQLPWGHNVVLTTKLKDTTLREWYARACIEHGWSRAVLVHQIESNLYERQGKALTNFDRALPAPQSDLARELVKDPYNLEFLGIVDEVSERELERSTVIRILMTPDYGGREWMNESTDIRPMDLTNLLIANATCAVTMMPTAMGMMMVKITNTIQKSLKGLGYGG